MTEDALSVPNAPLKRKAKSSGAIQFKKKMRMQAKKAHKEELESMTKIEEFNANTSTLLNKFKLGQTSQSNISQCLKELTQVLQNIPSSPLFQARDISWLTTEVVFPVPLPCDAKYSFKFQAPATVTLVGSHAVGLATKVTPVDLALEIPKPMWSDSDRINGRYHHKRALYLCYLALKLRNHPLVAKMVFNFHHGNPLKPILQLQVKAKPRPVWFNLLPHLPSDFFKWSKLHPDRNNVRPSWYFGGAVPEGVEVSQPTPLYNHSIMLDAHLCLMSEQLKKILSPLRAADRDGLVLLKHWLLTRGLDQGQGNFGGFLITVIAASLLHSGELKTPLTKFKVLQTALKYLSKDTWLEEGVTFTAETAVDKSVWGEVVIMDPSNTFNLATGITRAKARRVQHEAQLSLSSLKTFHLGFCQDFFSTSGASFYRKFDHVVQLDSPGSQNECLEKLGLKAALLDRVGDIPAALGPGLEKLLLQALGDRVLVLDRKSPSYLWWDVSAPPPDPNYLPQMKFGLLLNPELYLTLMDKGPCDATPEAKEFLRFWGSKSELRRLKDGSIREVVIWPGANFAERRGVPSHIVSYILESQAGISPSSVKYVAAQAEAILQRKVEMPPNFPPYGTGEECTLNILQAFDSLANMLRNLGTFAQSVTNIHGLTPDFCFTQTFPTLPLDSRINRSHFTEDQNCLVLKPDDNFCPSYQPTLDVCFLLEGDEVWQKLTDLEDLWHQKSLFYIAISDLLRDRFNLTVQPRSTGIDVIIQGYVFRLQLICHKERLLQEQEKAKELERTLLHLPRLVGLIQGLHQQHNTLGPSARLAKRWLASQRLLAPTLFPEVCVDLLVCYLYLHPLPFSRPCGPQVAFLRFLDLLASFDFAARPIIVNFNEEMTEEVLDEVTAELVKKRSELPPLVIATAHTRLGHVWTSPHPTKDILARVVEAARKSLPLLEQCLSSTSSFTKKEFCPPTKGDVVIHLNKNMVPFFWAGLFPKRHKQTCLKEYRKTDFEKIPVLNYDPPTTIFSTLQESYQEFAHFFYDCYGGLEIVMEWKPAAFVPVMFSMSKATNRKPSDDNPQMLVPDVDVILEEIKRLASPILYKMDVINKS